MTMFERYTDRARRTLVLAQDEARNLGHGHVSAGFLLLGLIAEDGGVAAQALKSLGVSLEDARHTVSREPCGPAAAPGAPLPFTPRLKIVLEAALRESLKLGHSYIATEHLLLGLTAGAAPGASPLVAIGVNPGDARAKVLELLRGYEEAGKPPASAGAADDPIAVVVEGIKDDHRQHVSANYPAPGICVSRCPEKWPCAPYRAAAALAAVLKAAGDWDAEAGRLDEKADEATPGSNDTTRTARAVMLSTRAQAHADLAAAARAAITRALTGEGK